jgi:uncharacterized protein
MKFILLMVVVGVVLWMISSRSRKGGPPVSPPVSPPARKPAVPSPMLACARCGMHVPQAEALTDSAGLPYCSVPHRDAGPGG